MKPIPSTSLADARAQANRCRQKIELCRDAIKMLSGATPDDFAFTFSMRGVPVLTLEIDENEADLCMSYFAYWHQFLGRRLNQLTTLIGDNKQSV